MREDPDLSENETDNHLMRQLLNIIAASKEQASDTLAATCDQLAKQGIDTLRIAYDGSCDEGTVQDVTAFADEVEVKLEADVREALCDVGYDLLPSGWEINEGSFGELVVDVASRQVTREHNWRVESTEYEEDTFAL